MFSTLGWLPPTPPNFRDLVRDIRRQAQVGSPPEALWSRLRTLAFHPLDEIQLSQIARLVNELPPSEGLPRIYRLGLIGDGTLSLFGAAIVASAIRRDLRVEVIEGNYGSAMSDATMPESPIRRAKPDAVLLANDRRGLGLDRFASSPEDARKRVSLALETVQAICVGLQQVASAVLIQTLSPPAESFFGSFDVRYAGSPSAQANEFNARLAELSEKEGYVVVDTARLAATIGLERWDDPSRWHASKLPFAPEMIPAYAEVVARTLGAIYGKSRKCLVIDLDNTIWGGVIGDDGIDGIVLGQGSAEGEAYLSVQRTILELRDRGVIIAVCSKNDEDNARLPFRAHPEMILNEGHIAVFQANWLDKAANLRAIADALNIGLDSLVFLDDNPAERALVREELPMVAVPELPSHAALYPRTLLMAGYFEAIGFGEEDRARSAYYRANVERSALQGQVSDLDGYLRSLAMTCSIRPFDAAGRSRIAQLINKSNQFNLTTRRFTEPEVARMESEPHKYTMQVRLADRFGDNGMISVIVADIAEEEWEIAVWLMSCRVLGRCVEDAVLRHLVTAARAGGAKRLLGRYVPSGRNQMVSDHYAKLGFTEIATDGSQSSWKLELQDYRPPNLPMEVDENVRVGETAAE